jgi:septum site-determining protein MinC
MLKGACELKSAQFSLMRLVIYQTDANAIQSFVADQVSAAPELLEGAPVALDFGACAAAVDAELIEDLMGRLRYAGVQPIALVSEADAPLAGVANQLRLGVLAPPLRSPKGNGKLESAKGSAKAELDKSTPVVAAASVLVAATPAPAIKAEAAVMAPVVATREPASVAAPAVNPSPLPVETQRYEGQVRSGQQLYAKGRDLIVTGAVGASSEVIADGSIHIYGRLMGKVIAGATGNRDARIYCLAFGAELISIAGVFRVFESIPGDLRGKAVQIWLDGDKLRFDALN